MITPAGQNDRQNPLPTNEVESELEADVDPRARIPHSHLSASSKIAPRIAFKPHPDLKCSDR